MPHRVVQDHRQQYCLHRKHALAVRKSVSHLHLRAPFPDAPSSTACKFILRVQHDRHGAFASNLVIEKSRRGCGLGKQVMRSAMAHAAQLGAERLYAEVHSNNDVRPAPVAPCSCRALYVPVPH